MGGDEPAAANRDPSDDGDGTDPARSADGTIHEPESGTVDDWFGQNVARDQDVADRVSDETADPGEAERAFDRRAVGKQRYEAGHPRPGTGREHLDDRREEWDERIGQGHDRSPADLLRAEPFGIPLHPVLTDLPIGFWTSSWILDLVGGEKGRDAAERLIGLGVLTAIPTAITGLVDRERHEPDMRSLATIHAGINLTATGLYGASWLLRRRGSRGAGLALAQVGALCATAGAALGRRLAFGPAPDRHDAAPDAAGPPTGPVAQR